MRVYRRVVALAFAVGASAFGTAAITVASPATAFAADVNGCSANVQKAHYSSSHGGIDLTAVWTCTDTSTIYMNPEGLPERYLVI